jgi:hypothetical protein
LLLSGVVALLGACSLSGGKADVATENPDACSNDRDCPAPSKCSRRACFAPGTPSIPLLMEVVPPAGAEGVAGISFTELFNYVSEPDLNSNITLGFVSRVHSIFEFEAVPPEQCVAPTVPSDQEAQISARVTLVPRKRLLGLPDAARVVEVPLGATEVSWNVAPGDYDVYVEPLSYGGSCFRPPAFFSSVTVPPGDVELPLELGSPDILDVVVRFPEAGGRLSGFTLDLVEASLGRLVSNRALLGEPIPSDGGEEYRVHLAVAPSDARTAGETLLRLGPPPETLAPTVYVPVAVAQLLEPTGAVLNQLSELPAPVRYSGHVVRAGSLSGERAFLTFLAESLDSLAPGTLATLTVEAEADSSGAFSVDLLPGTYQVHVEVTDPALARTVTRLLVESIGEQQAGRTIEVSPRRSVVGRLWSPLGHPLEGASVDGAAPPSTALPGDGYGSWLGERMGRPLALATTSGSDGRFELRSDAGTFDVVARPAAEGLPWLVRLGASVGDGDVIVGDMHPAVPFKITGKVASDDLGRAVPFALVRAYALIRSGAASTSVDEADYALAIGESRADENGRFDLHIPAEIMPPHPTTE